MPAGPTVVSREVTHFLTLYIAGLTPRSTLAVERIRSICDRYLAGHYELTVVDLFLHPTSTNRRGTDARQACPCATAAVHRGHVRREEDSSRS